MKKLQNKKGFTMAELLIVVAIIAVLVAISIPIFTAQLEKSRAATDAANIRSAYAEVTANYLGATNPASMTSSEKAITVTMKHTKASTVITLPSGVTDSTSKAKSTVSGGTVKVEIDANGNVSIK